MRYAVIAMLAAAPLGAQTTAAPAASAPPLAPVVVAPVGTPVAGPRLEGARPVRLRPLDTAEGSRPEAPVNGVVILYGNQQCPTNADGEEVVVCARRSAAEQFRIPRELRDGTIRPEYESFANRGQALLDAGRNGVGSCEPTGANVASGCSAAQYGAWKREKDAAKQAERKQR